MAFIYKNENYEKLTNEQIVADVLMTQNKIDADIRDILHTTKVIEFNGSTRIATFDLLRVFVKECRTGKYKDRDKSLRDLDDISCAWDPYENFIIPYISNLPFHSDTSWRLKFGNKYIEMDDSDELADIRTREKYKYYSNYVDKWYDFFMLPLDEKIKLLIPNKEGGRDD